MKYLKNYTELFEEIIDWKSIEIIIVDIADEWADSEEEDSFSSIEVHDLESFGSTYGLETVKKAKALIMIIIDLFNERSEKLSEILLNNGLWIEDKPNYHELFLYKINKKSKISDSDIKIVSKYLPVLGDDLLMARNLNNFGI